MSQSFDKQRMRDSKRSARGRISTVRMPGDIFCGPCWPAREHCSHARLARVVTVSNDKYLIRELQDIWSSFRIVLITAVPHLSNGLDLSRRRHRLSAKWLALFQNKLIRIAIASGTGEVLRYLKDLSHRCREAAVYNKLVQRLPFSGSIKDALQSRSPLFIMGRLGRALPAACRSIIEKAYAKHKDILTRPSDFDPEKMEPLRGFIRSWAKKRAGRCRPGMPTVHSMSSASCSSPVSKGGQASDLKAWLPRGPPATIESRGLNRRKMAQVPKAWASSLRKPYVVPPVCRAVALPERGGKARVITCMNTHEVMYGHVVRDLFWPLLVSERRVDLDSGSDPVTRISVPSGRLLVSTDLSSATDYAPFELGSLVWDAIVDGCNDAGWGINKEWVMNVVNTGLGPHIVQYPGSPQLITSLRGWLMGHPLTWMTLSVAHLGLSRGVLHDFVIRGDDLIGSATRQEVQRYVENLVTAGFILNESKTFLSSVGGIFAERAYTVLDGQVIRAKGDISLKGAVLPTAESLSTLAQRMEDESVSPLRRKVLAKAMLSKKNLRLVRPYMRPSIPWFLPRMLGGLGLLDPRGLAKSLVPHKRILMQACLTKESIPPIWATEAQLRAYMELDFQARRRTKKYFRAKEGRLSTWIPTQHLIEQGSLLHDIACQMDGGTVSESRPPKPSAIASRFKKLKKKCLRVRTEHGINPSLWSLRRIQMMLGISRTLGRYETSADSALSTKLSGVHSKIVSKRPG